MKRSNNAIKWKTKTEKRIKKNQEWVKRVNTKRIPSKIKEWSDWERKEKEGETWYFKVKAG